MRQPKIIFDNLSGKNVYSHNSSKTVTPTPDHSCPSCKNPIYDKKPVCTVCFRTGKFPKKLWKKNNKPKISSLPKKWLRKRRGKKGKPWYEPKPKPKKEKKTTMKQTKLQLLRKLGANNFYKLENDVGG